MSELPTNQYVEIRNGGYYVAGTRIGLDLLIHDFREGRSAEDIYKAYFSTTPLSRIYGAITFILEHPEAVEQYLADQRRLWKELQEKYPMPEELLQQLEDDGAEREQKLA